MRIALLSDVHANLPALESVLADIGHRDTQVTYHVGDLVGYAPWPNETVDLLSEHGVYGVSGNYDSTVGFSYRHCGCQYQDPVQRDQAHESFVWTCASTTDRVKAVLRALPFRLDVRVRGGHAAGPKLVLVHGAPTLNTLYWREDRSDEFCLQMASAAGLHTGDLIAFGHTHLPWHRVVEGIHFLNTGSVGRPKDGDWRAGYVVVEYRGDTGWRPEFARVEYDIARSRQAILESTLPHAFADYLSSGGGPVPALPASS